MDGREKIQCSWKGLGAWTRYNGNNPDFSDPEMEWRPEPERKLRQFKLEEVPHEALFRMMGGSVASKLIAIDFELNIVYFTSIPCNGTFTVSLQTLQQQWQHSLDHGLTWNPCGVMEGD